MNLSGFICCNKLQLFSLIFQSILRVSPYVFCCLLYVIYRRAGYVFHRSLLRVLP